MNFCFSWKPFFLFVEITSWDSLTDVPFSIFLLSPTDVGDPGPYPKLFPCKDPRIRIWILELIQDFFPTKNCVALKNVKTVIMTVSSEMDVDFFETCEVSKLTPRSDLDPTKIISDPQHRLPTGSGPSPRAWHPPYLAPKKLIIHRYHCSLLPPPSVRNTVDANVWWSIVRYIKRGN